MKKVLTVFAVLVMFLFLFTVQNSLAQEDPFEIGKNIVMDEGAYDSYLSVWSKDSQRGSSTSTFSGVYDTKRNAITFLETSKSGNGIDMGWTKECNITKYTKATWHMKDGNPVVPETLEEFKKQFVTITREEAEKEAWRILYYFR